MLVPSMLLQSHQSGPPADEMAQGAEPQPSFEDVFNILSHVPQDRLLHLKHKLKHLSHGPSSRLLQGMVLLTLGQEAEARICLDALRGNRAAQYVCQTKLRVTGLQEGGEDLQPPQLDADAMELLAQIYSVLEEEKLCSPKAMDKVHQAATQACTTSKETQEDALNSFPTEDQEEHVSDVSMGSRDRFQTLRSDVAVAPLQITSPNCPGRSSPVPIGGNSAPLGPHTLRSRGSPSFSSHFEISASPTVAFHTPAPSPRSVPQPSRLCEGNTSTTGQPDGDRPSPIPEETSWASRPSSLHGQDTGSQVPQTSEKVLQVSSHHPTLPAPEMQPPELGAVKQPDESSDVSGTVATEPQEPQESTDEKQDEKQLSTGLPSSRAPVDTGFAHMSMKDSYVPAGISNSVPASISASLLPPPSSISSTLNPPTQQAPLYSSPSPAWPPPPPQAVAAVPASEPESGKFFTFVVLHASEDGIVAQRVKDRLENMGVPNGATLCEDFFIAGRSHLTCFQDALENSAFMLLLLTKNFLCNLCMFQTNTALMESILNPSKCDSVIPFVPKENPLERSQMPSILGGLMPLDENSLGFSRTVQNTFTPKRINKKKAMWDQAQRRKQLFNQGLHQPLQNLAALHLGPPPQQYPPQQWGPPSLTVPLAMYPPPTTDQPMGQMGPPPGHPSGCYMTPNQGSIIIQNAKMIQIGNHNVMEVETVRPGPQDNEEEAR
ncbi:TIR domain-containing adapter molecule 1 [Porphyrio hochstetteri]